MWYGHRVITVDAIFQNKNQSWNISNMQFEYSNAQESDYFDEPKSKLLMC